ncbi:MAG: hypothetical protein ACPIEU_09595 [Candidatus Puniceispirillaceae bacterium]
MLTELGQFNREEATMVLESISSLMMLPIFWLVIGMLFLGLELINQRVIYFLPGSMTALAISFSMVLHPAIPTYVPQPPATAGATFFFWLAMTCGGMAVFAILRPRIRRRNRRSDRRHLFNRMT